MCVKQFCDYFALGMIMNLWTSLSAVSLTQASTSPDVGIRDPTIASTSPDVGIRDPTIASISPDVGILAGGTRITVSGQNFPQRNVTMSYGRYTAASLETCSTTRCFLMTPPGDSSEVGVQLPVFLMFYGQASIPTSFAFTYQPNPRVNSIHPLKTLAAGGTTLTVEGEGFDSVNDPQLIVSMLHTITDSGIQNEAMFTSSCNVTTSDTLQCPTPAVDIPEQFKKAFNDQNERDKQKRSTTRRQISDADYLLDIEGESLKFYLGLKLDGDQSYNDLRESLPEYSQIQVFISEPEFDTFEGTKEVSGKDPLQITGKRLSDGLDITDYKITIGTGICTMVDLTANELFCEIPEEKDQQGDEHSVLVYPGTNLSPQLVGTVHVLITKYQLSNAVDLDSLKLQDLSYLL